MSPSHVVLTVLCGDTRQVTRTLPWGELVAPFSVGSSGDWVVQAEGVLSVHFYLSFHGSRLRCAAATDQAQVSVHGAQLQTTWAELTLPLEICFGSARLGVHALVGSLALSREPVPDLSLAQHRRPAPQDLTHSDVLTTQIIDLSGMCLSEPRDAPLRAAPAASEGALMAQTLRVMPLAQTQCDGGALRALAARLAASSAPATPEALQGAATRAGVRAGRAWLANCAEPWWAGLMSVSTPRFAGLAGLTGLAGFATSDSPALHALRRALGVLQRAGARGLADLRQTPPRERLIALALPLAAAALSWTIVASGIVGPRASEAPPASTAVEVDALEIAPLPAAPASPAALEVDALDVDALEVAAPPATSLQPAPEALPTELDSPPARPDLQRQAFRAAFNGADVEAAALYRQLAARRDAALFELASALAAQGRVRKP